ncbi:MAG: GNAT family N-acetyltransferase [Spirochaetaceae bacterium]|nr:GNAT family N-acetyltransferase [Spirochaetaceae bacterium]
MWTRANKQHLAAVSLYLLKDEVKHLTLSSRFHRGGRRLWPSGQLVFVNLEQDYSVSGVVLADSKGYLLTSFNPALKHDFTRVILAINYSIKVFCMIGQPEELQFFYGFFYDNLSVVVDYTLMNYHIWQPLPRVTLKLNCKLLESTTSHYKALLPLEEAFLREEVIIKNTKNTASIEKILSKYRKRLQNERMFHLVIDKKIVTKAGFTAEAYHYDMLGGVFTVTDYRRQGLSTALVAAMQGNAKRRGKGVGLFVKNGNEAALQLYYKNGFSKVGVLQVIYTNK